MKTRRNRKGRIMILSAFIFVSILVGCFILYQTSLNQPYTYYIASSQASLTLNNNGEEITLIRGTEVIGVKDAEDQNMMIVRIKKDNKEIEIKKEFLVERLEDCVTNTYVYPRLMINLRKEKGAPLEKITSHKGEALAISKIDYTQDFNKETGEVSGYMVQKDEQEYYVNALYVETTLEEANKAYPQSVVYSHYWDYYFGDDFSKQAYVDSLDYKPFPKKQYPNNPLKSNVNALHVSMNIFKEENDYLIDLCKQTKINALVIEVKNDSGEISYKSERCSDYLSNPEIATENATLTKSELKTLIDKCKNEGIYLIARIVTFKDQVFAQQNSDESILSSDGSLLVHNSENWPTAFSRKAWMYNVDIAKETAGLGFNEVQFDYVRFPDGLIDAELTNNINLHNQYDEYKTQALQRFLMYAHEELSPKEVYVAADVFAWPIVAQDDQNIGQFMPALANVVDVISPMPYPDHFGPGNLGSMQPWQNPQTTLESFSQIVGETLNTIPTPATYRTWIQGYACMGHVCTGSKDNPQRNYGSQELIEQIHGINNAGFEGYMVWSGYGGSTMFEERKSGFIDSILIENKKWKHRFQ